MKEPDGHFKSVDFFDAAQYRVIAYERNMFEKSGDVYQLHQRRDDQRCNKTAFRKCYTLWSELMDTGEKTYTKLKDDGNNIWIYPCNYVWLCSPFFVFVIFPC